MNVAAGCLLMGVFLSLCVLLPIGMPALLVCVTLESQPRFVALLAYGFFGFVAGVWLLRKSVGLLLALEERLSKNGA